MSISRYFAPAGAVKTEHVHFHPASAHVDVTRMDASFYPGCMFSDVCWITGALSRDDFFKHTSDELLMFIGGDPSDPENLNAEIELWIENDKLTLTTTCIVFVPAGAAHGRITVKNVTKPVFHYTCQLNTDTYEEIPAEATVPAGTYANNWVERYEPVDGRLPQAPEGFLTRLLWIDGKKLQDAPYLEAVWFHTSNDTGPEAHAHDFDEFIGFIGSDPEHPEDLGATVEFYIGDEYYTMNKSTLVYIPRGVKHSPILVPALSKPIIHFSGGNGGDYVRKGSDQF